MATDLPFDKAQTADDPTEISCDRGSLSPGTDPGRDTPGRPRNRAEYPVKVIRSAKRHKTVSGRIVDGVICVRIPDRMSIEEERLAVADMVERICRSARSDGVDLATRARWLAEKYDLPGPASITWSKTQHKRWGSCSRDGRIRISDRLVDVPGWVLDFVIIHELAHLLVYGHGPEFHLLVSRYRLAERAHGYLMAIDDRTA